MIKRFSLICVFLLLFSLAACKQAETQEETATMPTVDSNATIFRTLPSIYVAEDPFFFDAEGYAQEQGYKSVVYNAESDTFTLEMDGARYNRLVSELFENIQIGIDEILQNEYYSAYIKDIQYTADLGEFTFYVDRDTYSAEEDYTPEYIASFAVMYREVLELEPVVSFTIIDSADNSTIGRIILPDEE